MGGDLLLDGINHVAVITADTERFLEFYGEVFGATVMDRVDVPFGWLTLVDIGGGRELNVLQLHDRTEPAPHAPMFGRGPLDHLGFQAASREAFDEIRRRLMARGATDGFVTDFGTLYSLFFIDPDGLECEVLIPSPTPGPPNPPGTPAPGYAIGVP